MAEWYVYQHDGDPLGPWATEAVAEAILAGRLAPDVWVAAPGGPRWLRALDVPVIARLVDGIPTRPRRDSGLRLMPAIPPVGPKPSFESTMMIVREDELEPAPPTTRRTPPPFATPTSVDDAPPTDPALPPSPSSSSPSSPSPSPRPVSPNLRETMASVGNERRRRKKG